MEFPMACVRAVGWRVLLWLELIAHSTGRQLLRPTDVFSGEGVAVSGALHLVEAWSSTYLSSARQLQG
jgi:hypothetical protein